MAAAARAGPPFQMWQGASGVAYLGSASILNVPSQPGTRRASSPQPVNGVPQVPSSMIAAGLTWRATPAISRASSMKVSCVQPLRLQPPGSPGKMPTMSVPSSCSSQCRHSRRINARSSARFGHAEYQPGPTVLAAASSFIRIPRLWATAVASRIASANSAKMPSPPSAGRSNSVGTSQYSKPL
ncbi:MAG: hypothetical protein BWZ02_01928 [Lentisphaerae bacterium ADurb.BinA184]|nr:MAG: hypothetical protein BWZ02_01928 [Lentisphaerae bacterium ADurb.BinA184]